MSKLFLAFVTLFALVSIATAATNINTATQLELEMLQGIGPSKASAIVEYRKENGEFGSKNDLIEVSGIGEGTLNLIREEITVSEDKKPKK